MRLLSYNIHKGIGGLDRKYRLRRIIDVIAAENPDLVCAQEVEHGTTRCSFEDQPLHLARQLGLSYLLYQRNVPRQGGGYGNLILSRWPVLEPKFVCLSRRWAIRRGAQIARVQTPNGPLQLVNWHLGLAEQERRSQVKQLLADPHLEGRPEMPTLIVGDFNDWRNTLARTIFSRHGYRHLTEPISQFRSFPAYAPLGSLDKAFERGGLVLIAARIVKTKLTRLASDHLPLVLDFAMPHDPALFPVDLPEETSS